jgi:hypothetical protein
MGAVEVDISGNSFFRNSGDSERLRFHHSRPWSVGSHHNVRRSVYSISRTFLSADYVINVPKMKTHKKAGVTLGLKNLHGIVVQKESIPHYKSGPPPQGDEFPWAPSWGDRVLLRLSRFPLWGANSIVFRFERNQLNSFLHHSDGSWAGNDTVWRTILDICMIAHYADKMGKLRPNIQRNHLCIIDGVIGGEGGGPLRPSPNYSGLVLGSQDTVAADCVAANLMGFETSKLRYLANADKCPLRLGENRLNRIEIVSNEVSFKPRHFRPPPGWPTYLAKKN